MYRFLSKWVFGDAQKRLQFAILRAMAKSDSVAAIFITVFVASIFLMLTQPDYFDPFTRNEIVFIYSLWCLCNALFAFFIGPFIGGAFITLRLSFPAGSACCCILGCVVMSIAIVLYAFPDASLGEQFRYILESSINSALLTTPTWFLIAQWHHDDLVSAFLGRDIRQEEMPGRPPADFIWPSSDLASSDPVVSQPHPAASVESPILDRLPAEKRGQIQYMSAEGNYVMVTTSAGKELIRLTLMEAEAEVSQSGIRIHRSHWVATDELTRLRYDKGNPKIELKSGTILPASRKAIPLIREALGEGGE